MRRFSLFLSLLTALPAAAQTRPLPLNTLRDKIAGGWAGQMIGVSFGAPTEFRYRGAVVPQDRLPPWTPDRVSNSLDQDDLYVDMTFAKVLDDKGLNATTDDFGAMFRDAKYHLWHANLAARRALKRSVPASLSGTPKYNAHANDIDFQIESDFIGLMAPGMPRSATDIAWRVGRVMNYGDGIYGGIFVSCMYSAAFFESDPRKIVEAGLVCLPAQSPYARLITDLLAWHTQNPTDWLATWEQLQNTWDRRDPCPAGALKPFNIDAKLNGAYIALGLLYGGGDFAKTITIATRAGQDSDCNPSSAGGILGVVLGYEHIPDVWKAGIPAIADRRFSFTDYTFHSIVDSTFQRAIELAEANHGRIESDTLQVPVQSPKPARLEVWDDYGSPVERIAVSDARWQWTGPWTQAQSGERVSDSAGATAEIAFEGTGFILTGSYLPDGGLADITLDGRKAATVDVYPDEDRPKGGESVYHAFKLKPGRHTLRLTVLGKPYKDSSGAKIALEDLVVFR
jgi:hypothetical protein